MNIRNLWMYMLAGLILFDVVSLSYDWFGSAPSWVSAARIGFTIAFITTMTVRLSILYSDRKK